MTDGGEEETSFIKRNERVLLWSIPIFATIYWYETGTYGFEHSVFVMITICTILLMFVHNSLAQD